MRNLIVILVAALFSSTLAVPAHAAECATKVTLKGGSVANDVDCPIDGDDDDGDGLRPLTPKELRAIATRKLRQVGASRWQCLEPGVDCTTAPGEPAPALPQVTPGMVLTAFRSVPVPRLRSVSQPAAKTLVNFDTIFYTRTEPVERSVTLLGQRIDLDITPLRYAWHHGDGTSSVTGSPGGPYPDKSVTYRYQRAHTTVSHFVVVTWGARYRVNGGAWAPVPGTVTTTGPATGLRIAEATPVLVGSR